MMYLCINFGVLSKQCICLLYAARAGCSVDEWERRAKAASDLVGKCVTSGSRETYGTGWNRWQRHAGSSGFDRSGAQVHGVVLLLMLLPLRLRP